MFFLRNVPPSESTLVPSPSEEVLLKHPLSASRSSEYCSKGLPIFKSRSFHLLVWPFFITLGVQFMFITNITMYLKSFGLSKYSGVMIIISNLEACVIKIGLGHLSDRYIDSIPRIVYKLIGNIGQVLAFLILPFFGNNIIVFITLTLVILFSNSVTWGTMPVLLNERYGPAIFGKIWGWIVFVGAVISMGFQSIFAFEYQFKIEDKNSIYCTDLDCYFYSSLLCGVMSVCCVVCNVLYLRRTREL